MPHEADHSILSGINQMTNMSTSKIPPQISYTDAVNLTLKELKGNSTPAAAPASAKGGSGVRHSHRNRDQESVVTGVSSVASSRPPRPSRRVQMGDLEFRWRGRGVFFAAQG